MSDKNNMKYFLEAIQKNAELTENLLKYIKAAYKLSRVKDIAVFVLSIAVIFLLLCCALAMKLG